MLCAGIDGHGHREAIPGEWYTSEPGIVCTDAPSLLSMRVSLSPAAYADAPARLQFWDEAVEDEALMDSLRESVERFEVEHPRATGILNNIMVMLSNMGI